MKRLKDMMEEHVEELTLWVPPQKQQLGPKEEARLRKELEELEAEYSQDAMSLGAAIKEAVEKGQVVVQGDEEDFEIEVDDTRLEEDLSTALELLGRVSDLFCCIDHNRLQSVCGSYYYSRALALDADVADFLNNMEKG